MNDDHAGAAPRAGAFYGRRKGRPLKPRQADVTQTLLPALRLDLAAPAPSDLATLFPRPVSRVFLEIGFGGGEHLLNLAATEPDTGFIGCEPFVTGMATALSSVARPGDIVVTDNIAHHLIISLCSYLGLRLQGLGVDEQGVLPESLTLGTRSLEDVFLQLTGRELEEHPS